MIKVKICGITRAEDAALAAREGAWAVGLIFSPQSPRFVTAKQALAAIEALPKTVLRVGVFLNQSNEVIRRVENEVPLDLIQLHGRETEEQSVEVGQERCIKAFVLRQRADVDRASRYPCGFALADRSRSTRISPQPQEVRWELARGLAEKKARTLLAGGLDAGNVLDGIRTVRPWGVDVSSGIESSPGIKDPDKLRAFMEAVRSFKSEA